MLPTTVKTGLKSFLKFTPYELRKRKTEEADFDPISHNSRDAVNATYSSKKFVQSYVNHARKAFYRDTKDLILEAKNPETCKVVGDIGCGIGGFLERLMPQYGHCDLYGYDFSEVTLEVAQRNYARPVYEQYDIYTPPTRQHDLTICSQTIEHLLEPELALKHLIEATTFGGLLLITVPNGRTDTFKGHIQFWSPESWEAWIRRNTECDSKTVVMASGTMGSTNLAALIYP